VKSIHDEMDSLRVESLRLFYQRQRLIQERLKTEELEGVRDLYLAVREKEQDIKYQILRLKNSLDVQPQLFERTHRTIVPENSRLRIWVNVLIIIVLAFIILLMMWEHRIHPSGSEEELESRTEYTTRRESRLAGETSGDKGVEINHQV